MLETCRETKLDPFDQRWGHSPFSLDCCNGSSSREICVSSGLCRVRNGQRTRDCHTVSDGKGAKVCLGHRFRIAAICKSAGLLGDRLCDRVVSKNRPYMQLHMLPNQRRLKASKGERSVIRFESRRWRDRAALIHHSCNASRSYINQGKPAQSHHRRTGESVAASHAFAACASGSATSSK